jgi:hypothetical protein
MQQIKIRRPLPKVNTSDQPNILTSILILWEARTGEALELYEKHGRVKHWNFMRSTDGWNISTLWEARTGEA